MPFWQIYGQFSKGSENGSKTSGLKKATCRGTSNVVVIRFSSISWLSGNTVVKIRKFVLKRGGKIAITRFIKVSCRASGGICASTIPSMVVMWSVSAIYKITGGCWLTGNWLLLLLVIICCPISCWANLIQTRCALGTPWTPVLSLPRNSKRLEDHIWPLRAPKYLLMGTKWVSNKDPRYLFTSVGNVRAKF